MLLQARLVKLFKDTLNVLHQIVNVVTQKTLFEEDRDFMLDLIREEPTTLVTIQKVCHDVNGRWFSLPTICQCLDEFGYSFKCVTLVDEQSETPENLARRAGYARDFATSSVSTRQLCLTWMRLVSTSPCAAHMDTHLNTTTTLFEQQKQHPPT